MRVDQLSSPASRRMFLVSAPPKARSLAHGGCGALLKLAACSALAAALLGCAAQQDVLTRTARSKEYFPESLYGRASPRLIAYGQIPHGGGQYLVGRPYTVAGRVYVPHVMNQAFSEVGTASWYGDAFHGRRTANGEIYDKDGVTAAHPTMPLPSYARVTNLRNGLSIVVRVNDRGPYHAGRVMDVSSRVADLLDFKRFGMAKVRVDYIGPASLSGSSNRELMATLTTDGRPAMLDGAPDTPRTMFASAVPFIASPLKSLFGARRPAAEPARPQPRSQTATLAETAHEPAIAPTRTAYLPARTPLPPSRPFDLRTIPGAGVPIGAPRLPRSAALSYAPDREVRPKTRENPLQTDQFAPTPPIRGSAY